MSNNLIDAGYFIIKNKNPDTDALSERFVEVLIDSESDEIVEPYFFLYNYGQSDRSMYYSIPTEVLNHSETYNNTLSLAGNNIPAKGGVLSYLDKIYVPQIHPSSFASPIGTAPTVIEVCTGSENNAVNFSMGHIYLMLKKGDYEANLYARIEDLSFANSHSESNPSERNSLLNAPITLDKPEADLRSLVVTLSQDVKEINYGEAIYGDEVERPVKWVVSFDTGSVRDLPSVDRIQTLAKYPITENNSKLQSMKIDIGTESGLIDFTSNPLLDINFVVNNTTLSINNKVISNEKPF